MQYMAYTDLKQRTTKQYNFLNFYREPALTVFSVLPPSR